MEKLKHKKIPRQYFSNDFIDKVWLRRFFSDILHAKKFSGNPTLNGKVIASLFLEPTKTTELSFSVALARLGTETLFFKSLNSRMNTSSTTALITQLKKMDVDGIILKSPDIRDYDMLKKLDILSISGGCEMYGNPMQSLQDIYTLWQEHRRTTNLSILAIGDNSGSKHIQSTMKLLEIAGLDATALYINDFDNIKGFLSVLEREIEKHKLIYIMEDEQDKFADIEDTQGYSVENKIIFQRIITEIKGHKRDILHSGSKSLDNMLDDYLDSGSSSIQSEKLKNGVIVKIHILYSMFNNAKNEVLI